MQVKANEIEIVEAVTGIGKKGDILHVTWEPGKFIDMIVTHNHM
jgi:hypothetical protein